MARHKLIHINREYLKSGVSDLEIISFAKSCARCCVQSMCTSPAGGWKFEPAGLVCRTTIPNVMTLSAPVTLARRSRISVP